MLPPAISQLQSLLREGRVREETELFDEVLNELDLLSELFDRVASEPHLEDLTRNMFNKGFAAATGSSPGKCPCCHRKFT